MNIVILIPDSYSPNKYPGFYQKYVEIAESFSRRGCSVDIIGYRGTVTGIFRLRRHRKLLDADIIWVRCPGVRVWLMTIAVSRFRHVAKLLLEHPSPFSTYLTANIQSSKWTRRILFWGEMFLTIITFAFPGKRFDVIVGYGEEKPIISRIFRLKIVGLLAGNVVPGTVARVLPVAHNNAQGDLDAQEESLKPMFLIVASLATWHAIDRLIVGLGKLSKTSESGSPHLVVIGEVPVALKQELIEIAKSYGITHTISFLGQKSPDQIPDLIGRRCIGISALGIHRLGYRIASPLKSGFYTSSGIPFICSCVDKRFPPDFPYRFQCPADDSPIDVAAVMAWYKKLDDKRTAEDMRDYYLSGLASDRLLTPIFNRLEIPKSVI